MPRLEFYKLGIDGGFSDFPDTAVVSRFLFELERCLDRAHEGPMRHRPECD